MAYSEYQKERIEKSLKEKIKNFEGKKFMGGYCFFVDDKMCVGLDIDKATGKDRLMARIGDDFMTKALKTKGCKPMDITGRPLKGFAFVDPEGFDLDKDLDYWVQLCVDHNPFAKRSKKK
ncbi:MAG: TfoX/Sxy family protein [Bacteroidetes bacterium]|nr:TfoX/Sxy family protein [Bacteroidota bacterium]MBU1484120.1 TfoX/Sxy family protein [Bacteroidota bacterium]MBU2045610.1 TfoX/Sxy family protein [Bacteroidota bacterium]MBU2267001.1 TfoX/Sxy family protein [Bacteroidota bacterium]MBU2375431.1 TfoX/Sxy family protein [Bacteroidota bacterium]